VQQLYFTRKFTFLNFMFNPLKNSVNLEYKIQVEKSNFKVILIICKKSLDVYSVYWTCVRHICYIYIRYNRYICGSAEQQIMSTHWRGKAGKERASEFVRKVSISSTFYVRIIRTKDNSVTFSSYILALAKGFWWKKHFRTKNAFVKCWWNWLKHSVDEWPTQ